MKKSKFSALNVISLSCSKRCLLFTCFTFILMCIFLIVNYRTLIFVDADPEPVLSVFFLTVNIRIIFVLCYSICIKISLEDKIKRITGNVALFVMPLFSFISAEIINSNPLYNFNLSKWIGNYLCCLFIYSIIHLICNNAFLTVSISSFLLLIFSTATYFTVEFRGVPMLPWDVQTIGTAADVIGGYDFFITPQLYIISVLHIVIGIILWKVIGLIPARKLPIKKHIVQRLSSFCACALIFILLFPLNILSALGIEVFAWNQTQSLLITGVNAGFVANMQYMLVQKPADYSLEKLEELKEEISLMEEPEPLGFPDSPPTIIAILNESLTDITAISDISLNKDYLPFIHSLEQSGEVIWGGAYSSVFGGSTCNTEYELFTSNSMAFLPAGSKPQQQYVTSPQQTLMTTLLENYGYESTGIHPGSKTAWSRERAYPFYGFSDFIYATRFNVEREMLRNLTTDASSYDQIIYSYENRNKDNPQFIFNLTIQNHSGYTFPLFESGFYVKDSQGKFPEAEQYLEIASRSDEAFEDLVAYFSKQSDPVLIFMAGDHWPPFTPEFRRALFGKRNRDLSFEETMTKYYVPFIIWANYPLDAQYIKNTSMNYLAGTILQAAGLYGSSYHKFLNNLYQYIPVISEIGKIDSDGIHYKAGDPTPYDDIINDYAILQYNRSFDKENLIDLS